MLAAEHASQIDPSEGTHPARAAARLAALEAIGDACPVVWRHRCRCRAGERCKACRARIEAVRQLVSLTGPLTLREVGALLGVTGERVRDLEALAFERAAAALRAAGVDASAFAAEPERPRGMRGLRL